MYLERDTPELQHRLHTHRILHLPDSPQIPRPLAEPGVISQFGVIENFFTLGSMKFSESDGQIFSVWEGAHPLLEKKYTLPRQTMFNIN